MPANTKHKTTSPSARNRAAARGNKAGSGRKDSRGRKADTPRIIANSFFALTAGPKPAIAVSLVQSGKTDLSAVDDYQKIYADVLQCAQRAIFLVTGEVTRFNPLKSGYDISESFDFIFRMLKTNVIPEGWEYNIEKDQKNEYHIVIYRSCEFNSFWHVFDIGKTVLFLYRRNRRLHDMFILFLHNFCRFTGIDTWHKHGVGYADEWTVMDHFENSDRFENDEDEAKQRYEIEKTIEDYKTGTVAQYLKLINEQEDLTVDEIRQHLKRFSRKNALVCWMYSACDVMELNYHLSDFTYPELIEEGDTGVLFDDQLNVLWDLDDAYCQEQEEFLNAEAEGVGIMDPIYHVRLTKTRKSLDLDRLKKAPDFPKKLTKIFYEYQDAIKKYK